MALNSKNYKQESKFPTPDPLDVGTYPARVVQVISLGLQKQDPYKGEEKAPKHELYVTYELLDEFMKDEEGNDITDKPRWLSETFTMNSLDSDLAKSTKRYTALDPEMKHEGDWANIPGSACMVTIVQNKGKGKHDGKVFNNISSVQSMRAKEESKAEPLVNEPKIFDIDDPDMKVFLSLPQFLQDKIKGNLEYDGSALEHALQSHRDGGDTNPTKDDEGPDKPSQTAPDAGNDEEEDW